MLWRTGALWFWLRETAAAPRADDHPAVAEPVARLQLIGTDAIGSISSIEGRHSLLKGRPLQAGDIIDGFRLDEQLEPGGMAEFWRVSHSGISLPLIMKIPLLRRGEDPLAIVGFEQEQVILSRLTGPHVPRFIAAGDFERPYTWHSPPPESGLMTSEREKPFNERQMHWKTLSHSHRKVM